MCTPRRTTSITKMVERKNHSISCGSVSDEKDADETRDFLDETELRVEGPLEPLLRTSLRCTQEEGFLAANSPACTRRRSHLFVLNESAMRRRTADVQLMSRAFCVSEQGRHRWKDYLVEVGASGKHSTTTSIETTNRLSRVSSEGLLNGKPSEFTQSYKACALPSVWTRACTRTSDIATRFSWYFVLRLLCTYVHLRILDEIALNPLTELSRGGAADLADHSTWRSWTEVVYSWGMQALAMFLLFVALPTQSINSKEEDAPEDSRPSSSAALEEYLANTGFGDGGEENPQAYVLKTISSIDSMRNIQSCGKSRMVSTIANKREVLLPMSPLEPWDFLHMHEDKAQMNTPFYNCKKVDSMLEMIGKKEVCFCFDTILFHKLTHGKPLETVAMYLIETRFDLVRKLNLNESLLRHFLAHVERGYFPENPYHNNTHAADVTQRLASILIVSGLDTEVLDSVDVLAVIIASCIHDFEHPGTNNHFQVETSTCIARQFNDQRVLENHALVQCLGLMRQFNFAQRLSREKQSLLRSHIISAVLATNMAEHFEVLAQFAKEVPMEVHPNMPARARSSLMNVALKCADIGHVTMPIEQHLVWVESLQEEFYIQGDNERALGLKVSPMMSREEDNGPAHGEQQGGFLDCVCLTMLRAWVQRFPNCKGMLMGLENVRSYWIMDKQAAQLEKEAAQEEATRNVTPDLVCTATADTIAQGKKTPLKNTARARSCREIRSRSSSLFTPAPAHATRRRLSLQLSRADRDLLGRKIQESCKKPHDE